MGHMFIVLYLVFYKYIKIFVKISARYDCDTNGFSNKNFLCGSNLMLRERKRERERERRRVMAAKCSGKIISNS